MVPGYYHHGWVLHGGNPSSQCGFRLSKTLAWAEGGWSHSIEGRVLLELTGTSNYSFMSRQLGWTSGVEWVEPRR